MINILDAAITCDASNAALGLFDARCSHGGFKITVFVSRLLTFSKTLFSKVNEACRLSHFAGIDFANSFLWGDATKTIMVDPTKTDADAVVAGAVAAGTTCVPKPTGVDITDDAADPYDIYSMLSYTGTTKSWVGLGVCRNR